MKVLLIGNGGREHALAWKLASSPRVTALLVAPGNAGTAQIAENIPVGVMDFERIEKTVRQNRIEFVVIGPEETLSAGLADRIAAMGVGVFGPTKQAAQLEADKWFAKELMRHQAVPTADARAFTDASSAEEYVRGREGPIVIKASGLARGKGVSVCHRQPEALSAIDALMRRHTLGAAGERVVIEEFLSGPECSVLAFVDRNSIYMMETC
ncbi:MAG: phosphoribosylamine--glycine ligase, partial [Tepidisphaeraceae bacterium]